MPTTLDAIDKRILRALQRNGRMSNVELANEVGLTLTVFARVWFKTQDAEITHQFAETVRKFPEVVECYLTTGECDALLRIVTADLHAYWRFQSDYLMRIPSVQSVKTDVPMETIKRSYELPL
jgi:DNA-binding Lrp family transcriptional regulator